MDHEALTDPRCVATTDALVLDGANGVCRDARLGARDEVPWRAGALALAVVLALAVLASRRAWRGPVLLVLAIVAALPGLASIALERADRPAEIARSAGEITALHDAIRGFAEEHGCAEVAVDECLACQPIARLALAGRACEAPARVELRAGALGGSCEARGRVLACGAP